MTDDLLELGLRAEHGLAGENEGPLGIRVTHILMRGWRAMPWSYLNRRHEPTEVWAGERPAGQMM